MNSFFFFFFFKQKTAYEITASDWCSDVCSSDLASPLAPRRGAADPVWVARSGACRDRPRSEERRVGKGVRCCVDLGGRRIIKKKKKIKEYYVDVALKRDDIVITKKIY